MHNRHKILPRGNLFRRKTPTKVLPYIIQMSFIRANTISPLEDVNIPREIEERRSKTDVDQTLAQLGLFFHFASLQDK